MFKCLLPRFARPHQFFQFEIDVFFDPVHLMRLVQGGHEIHRILDPFDQIGKGVPQKSRNAQRHIDARPAQFFQRNDFHTDDPIRTAQPYRL